MTREAAAIPAFARETGFSCVMCHAAFPRLNQFGETFKENNYRLGEQESPNAVATGDTLLSLPKNLPLAVRMQSYIQARQAEEVDPATGPTGNNSAFDFQTPYLIKLLSGAPISKNLTYYFYAIIAEKGDNGSMTLEDAWLRYEDLFGSGISVQVGQFQVGELMFARELRMTFQDFIAYRMAGLTYERGVVFDRPLGPVELFLGFVNGNGNSTSFAVNSPGFSRPDRMFDNDSTKTGFLRISSVIPSFGKLGVFGQTGRQASAGGGNQTLKQVIGFDLSGDVSQRFYWFGQTLWNYWDDFLETQPGRNYHWFGGFAGVDYLLSDRWVFSLLYNGAESGDFDGTSTIYQGIKTNTLTLGASYYLVRNAKVMMEGGVDFLGSNPGTVGHVTQEGYLLVGMDAAF